MTNEQLKDFKTQLTEWKMSIEEEIKNEIEIEINEPNTDSEEADEGDTIDKNNIIDFQQKRREKYDFLLKEINYALQKIENNTYGICEDTDEEIDIQRLKANPIARYSIEAQRLIENKG